MRYISKLKGSHFIKNILVLTSGTAIAQLLTVGLSPVITRIYSPNEYGVLTVFISLVTIVSVGITLDYSKAIAISENDNEAVSVLILSIFITFFLSAGLTVLLFLLGDLILNKLHASVLVDYKYLLSIGVFLLGIYEVLTNWTIRSKDFINLTRTKLTQSISSNVTKIAFGLMSMGPIALIIGQIIGQSGGIFRLIKPILKTNDIRRNVKLPSLIKVGVRYKKFPLYSTPSNYIYTLGSELPVIMLAVMFTSSVAGLYGLANSIINVPVALISNSVSQVFYSEVASAGKGNPQKVLTMSNNVLKKMVLVGVVPFLALVIFGPSLFTLVFGEKWAEVGEYARIMAIVSFTHFIILPIGRVLSVMEKQQVGLIINVFRLLLIIGVFVMSKVLLLNEFNTIIMLSIIISLSHLLLLLAVQVVLCHEIKNRAQKVE